jgi:putative SOS response-associated peptidase YedK
MTISVIGSDGQCSGALRTCIPSCMKERPSTVTPSPPATAACTPIRLLAVQTAVNSSGRRLIIADGFYEFTTPDDKKKKRKDKWLFTLKDEPWFCIAGLSRVNEGVGEAFTMLTMEPGPDIALYHDRQIAILARADWADWADWLDPSVSAKMLLKPMPAGCLSAKQVG